MTAQKQRGFLFMLNEAWKRRLINIAHSGSGKEFHLKTRMEFPKTVLGQKIYQSKTMSHTFPWLHKIKFPTLILTGEKDAGCNPKLNKFIADQLPNSKLVILPNYKPVSYTHLTLPTKA